MQSTGQLQQPLVFDLEADNLKENVTRIWCITINDQHYGPDQIDHAVEVLNGSWVVGHNIINYDLEVIKKFYPWFKPAKIDDTFILSCLFEPDRSGHGLADWGIQFGIPKPVHEDWTQYSPEMRHRNIEDVRITERVYQHLLKERQSWDWEPAIRLEYRIAQLHAIQEANGVGFDMDAALALHSKITAEVAEIDEKILRNIPPKWVKVGETMSKPFKINGELNGRAKAWMNESYPELQG